MRTNDARWRLLGCAALLLVACAPTARTAPTRGPVQAAPTALPTATVPPPSAPGANAAPAFDERAVADFYRGKTIRILVGFAAGGAFDLYSRAVVRYMPKYVPGNPTMIVENRPGAGGLLVANAVYKVEPKDGTVIANTNSYVAMQQAIGASGVEFDVARFKWLGSARKDYQLCAVRTDLGIGNIQEVIDGREVVVGTAGPGSNTHDTPAVLRAALGANFKLVPGYDGTGKILLAFEGKEIDAFCGSINFLEGPANQFVEGPSASARVLIMAGAETPTHRLLHDVPASEQLAPTEQARQLMRAAEAPNLAAIPWAVAPEVPAERVAALRKALMDTFADAGFLAEMERAKLGPDPNSGEETAERLAGVVRTPPDILARLKDVLK